MQFKLTRSTTLPLAVLVLCAGSHGQSTWRASVSTSGTQANGDSRAPSSSALGRFVAFKSDATNLVANDTNGVGDVFVHDRLLGMTTRVSVSSGGSEGDGESFNPSISDNGRFVTFFSEATNLVAGDTNGRIDVFVHDRTTGATERVSVSSAGGQGNDDSDFAEMSGNGRFVVFRSYATNLVAGDTNGQRDVFLHDRATGTTLMASVGSGGTLSNGNSEGADVSNDGRIVSFASDATNLVAGDTNGVRDIFWHDFSTGTTHRASVSTGGAQATLGSDVPTISANGHVIAFSSDATNLVPGVPGQNVFAHNRLTGTTVVVSVDSSGSVGNAGSSFPSLNRLGQFVAFQSNATNLVAGDTNGHPDIFVHDLATGMTIRASLGSTGLEGNGSSQAPDISPEGRFVSFRSGASDLVPGDTNALGDVFVRDTMGCSTPTVYCTAKTNSLGCVPAIGSLGTPSSSAGSGFEVTCVQVRNQKFGLLFYSLAGRLSAPFQGGTLCVKTPIQRAIAQSAGGNPSPANDCSGMYRFDLNAFAVGALGRNPAVELQVVGQQVNCQWWGRDQGFPAPFNTMLSEGLEYFVCL